jgi:hypothetical protein
VASQAIFASVKSPMEKDSSVALPEMCPVAPNGLASDEMTMVTCRQLAQKSRLPERVPLQRFSRQTSAVMEDLPAHWLHRAAAPFERPAA